MKVKSPKNKTIDISVKDGKEYLKRCVKVTDIKTGDVTGLTDKTLVGDTFEGLKRIPNGFADLIIVDPPYNLDKNFHGNKFSAKNNAEYKEYVNEWLKECHRILKSDGSIYVCCDWKSGMVIGECVAELFVLRNRITWQREKGRGAKQNWKNGLEDIYFATKSDDYFFNLDKVKIRRKVLAPYKAEGKPKDWEETKEGKFRNTCPSNFWDDISVPYWSMPENTEHPTQKPEKLIAKLILASSKDGGMVFDPFLGSGTTSVVAKKLGRTYLGIEQNPQYCVWTEKRLELAETDKTIQGYDGKFFWERNARQKK